jgi:hypothetical protein
MTDPAIDEGVLGTLADKLNGLDLSDAEGAALSSILGRAAGADTDEVSGFGWDEGVAAVRDPAPPQVSGNPLVGLKIDPRQLGSALGYKY